MGERGITRLEEFEKALKQLKEAGNLTTLNELEKDGLLQRYEFTLELAWKCIKDFAEAQGFQDVISPKSAFQKAYELELISNKEDWLTMLEHRNMLSHMYDQLLSEAALKEIRSKYINELEILLSNLKKSL